MAWSSSESPDLGRAGPAAGRARAFRLRVREKHQSNRRPDELRALRRLADEMLALDEPALDAMLANGTIAMRGTNG